MKTTAPTATKSLSRVRAAAEAIKSDAPQCFPEAASPGECVRQGDLYIAMLDSVPRGATRVASPDPQLAPGTTRGSRHVLDSLDGVTVYTKPAPDALDGPILDLSTERTVTHPEHGDWTLGPGVYAITYQRAFADELRRVAD